MRRMILAAAMLTACASSNDDGLDEARGKQTARVLAPGEVIELAVNAVGVAGGTFATTAGEEYVLVLASTKLDGEQRELPWSVDRSAPPLATETPSATVSGCSIDAAAWSAITHPAEPLPAGTAVALGTSKVMHASTPTGDEDIPVKAIAVGERAVVWADVSEAHPAVLDPAFVTQFLSDFENTILPRERSVFGVESDVDRDGRIGLVFTPLTHRTSVAYFESCDLTPTCKTSNGGDYLWLTPPNAIDPPYNTPNAIKEILAHELAHLVHFHRKALRNQTTDWNESAYMIEGVGALAQDAIGPQSGNLYVAKAGLEGIGKYSLIDTLTDGTRYDRDRDGILRGGSYLFVRWLYDRGGGDSASGVRIEDRGGPAFLRTLLDARASIAKTLPRITQRSIADIATDFYTTLAMSNRDQAPTGGVAPLNRCFAYLPTQVDPVTNKQRGANVFARFHGQQLSGVPLSTSMSGTIRTGGAAYVSLPTPATRVGGPLSFTVNVDPAAAARIRLGRIR